MKVFWKFFLFKPLLDESFSENCCRCYSMNFYVMMISVCVYCQGELRQQRGRCHLWCITGAECQHIQIPVRPLSSLAASSPILLFFFLTLSVWARSRPSVLTVGFFGDIVNLIGVMPWNIKTCRYHISYTTSHVDYTVLNMQTQPHI